MSYRLIAFASLAPLFMAVLTPPVSAVESGSYAPAISYSEPNPLRPMSHPKESFFGVGTAMVEFALPPVADEKLMVRESEGPTRTGVVEKLQNPIDVSMLQWERTANGFATRIRISSERARRLRIHASFSGPAPALEFRVKGSDDDSVLLVTPSVETGSAGMWLPLTNGSLAELEIFVRSETGHPDVRVGIDQVNHIHNDVTPAAKNAARLGLAEYDEYDLVCFEKYSNYNGIRSAASASAKISFIRNGSSYVCSGTLLNDQGSTGTPWFSTAAHCIPDQATADSMTFEWSYEAMRCGFPITSSGYSQTYGGAKLLWSNASYDASFLKLNNPPDRSATYAGWNSKPLFVGESVYGIHHPRGDHTMVSLGQVVDLGVTTSNLDTGQTLTVNQVKFSMGGTEQGSSGSGLFSGVLGDQLQWRGALFGGPPGKYQTGYYTPFDRYFSYIRQYLETKSSDTIPPSVPTGLTATIVSNTRVLVAWKSSTDNVGVVNYRLYVNGGMFGGLGAVNSFPMDVSPGTTYSYTVSACDVAGNCSAQSIPVLVTMPGVMPISTPSLPIGVTPTSGNGTITLSFGPPTSNGGAVITEYLASCGANMTRGSGSPLTVRGLTNGVTYVCSVSAINLAGSGTAAIVIATPTASASSPAPVPAPTSQMTLRDAIYLYSAPLTANGDKTLTGVDCDVFQLVLDVKTGYTDLAIGQGANLSAAVAMSNTYPDTIRSEAQMFAYSLYGDPPVKTFSFKDRSSVASKAQMGTATAFGYCFSTKSTAHVYFQQSDVCTNSYSDGRTTSCAVADNGGGGGTVSSMTLRDAVYLYGQDLRKNSQVSIRGKDCDVLQLILDVETGYADIAMLDGTATTPYPDRIDAQADMFGYALYSNSQWKGFSLGDKSPQGQDESIGRATAFGYCYSSKADAYVLRQNSADGSCMNSRNQPISCP